MEQKLLLWLSSPCHGSLSPSTNREVRVKIHIEPVSNASYSIICGNRTTAFAKCYPELDVSIFFLYVSFFFFSQTLTSLISCPRVLMHICMSALFLFISLESGWGVLCVFACECWWKTSLEGLQPSLSHLCSLETTLSVHALSDTLRTDQHRLDAKMRDTIFPDWVSDDKKHWVFIIQKVFAKPYVLKTVLLLDSRLKQPLVTVGKMSRILLYM